MFIIVFKVECLIDQRNIYFPNSIKNYSPFNEFLFCHETCRNNFECSVYNYCIAMSRVCDGIPDCLLHDDEENCGIGKVPRYRIMNFFCH